MNIDNLEKWHFERTESACNHLLNLVLKGKKKATSGSIPGYESEGGGIPKEGDLSVITDWYGSPCCIIRTRKVHVLPFREVTFEMARLEGEDDSLESWRENHEHYFREEGKALGYQFSENMDIIFEEFEVIERIGE